jgi:hypothetical protein
MFEFLISFLIFRRYGLPRIVWYTLLVFAVGLVIVVLIYTTNLFLTLNERSHAPHVHTQRTH